MKKRTGKRHKDSSTGFIRTIGKSSSIDLNNSHPYWEENDTNKIQNNLILWPTNLIIIYYDLL